MDRLERMYRAYLRQQELELERKRLAGLSHEWPKSAPSQPETTNGSGFLVSNNLVVTNFHVIVEAKNVLCFVSGTPNTASIVEADPENDVALLLLSTIVNGDRNFLRVGEASRVMQGAKVYAFGFPVTSVLGENLKVTEGIIASLSGSGGSTSSFQLDMNVHPGNSGGPVLDRFGNVIGIVSSKLDLEYAAKFRDLPSGISFAKKADSIRLLVSAAGRTGEVQFEHQEKQEFSLEQMTDRYSVAVVRIEVRR